MPWSPPMTPPPAAPSSLNRPGLAGKVAISGQDADLAGVKRIISGTQTMTVYKPITTRPPTPLKSPLSWVTISSRRPIPR
nr:D-xylose-binding periplasmic protein precursor [Klebsiella pneumoniae]